MTAHTTDYYKFNITKLTDRILITLNICPQLENGTNGLVLNKLKSNLPGIFSHKCFNYKNHPFSEEVKNTNIGHLFEHILLETLCRQKVGMGSKKAAFRGETRWDWTKQKGKFMIDIDVCSDDFIYLKKAVCEAVGIFDSVIQLAMG